MRAAAQSPSPDADAALAELCQLYWLPVYAFVRRSGHDPDAARDLTQDFFVRVLEKHYFKDARPERGRFRSFLIASVRHFLAKERHYDRALKRGGRHVHVPIEIDDGERKYQREFADTETPERIYERGWAQAVLDAAMDRVAVRYPSGPKRQVFLRLRTSLLSDERQVYAQMAADLGTTEGALRVAAHRLRQQLGVALEEVIADTVGDPEEMADELRHVRASLAR